MKNQFFFFPFCVQVQNKIIRRLFTTFIFGNRIKAKRDCQWWYIYIYIAVPLEYIDPFANDSYTNA